MFVFYICDYFCFVNKFICIIFLRIGLYLQFITKSHHLAAAKSLQLCLTLCDPIDNMNPAVPGILQARTLERVAISFSNA